MGRSESSQYHFTFYVQCIIHCTGQGINFHMPLEKNLGKTVFVLFQYTFCTVTFHSSETLTISFFYFKVSVVEMHSRSMRILGVDDGAHAHSRKWQFTWKIKRIVSSRQSPGLLQTNSNMDSGSIFKNRFLICLLD